MTDRVSHDDIMRYLDGELPPSEHRRVEAEVQASPELQRDIAIYRAMRDDFHGLAFRSRRGDQSVWNSMNIRVVRPVGWIVGVAGGLAWTGYAGYAFATSHADILEKLAAAAVVIGTLTLLASVIIQRYREWGTDPYKDVHR